MVKIDVSIRSREPAELNQKLDELIGRFRPASVQVSEPRVPAALPEGVIERRFVFVLA